MITIGEGEISTLYLGDTKIKRAYVGNALVFEGEKKPSRLPEGYTELQYIGNPNLAYIQNFGMTSSYLNSYKMELDIEIMDDTEAGTICGTYNYAYYFPNSSSSTRVQSAYSNSILYSLSSSSFTLQYSGSSTSTGGIKSIKLAAKIGRNKIFVDSANRKFIVNEDEGDMTASATPGTKSPVPCLFARNNVTQTATGGTVKTTYGNGPVNIRFYSLKFYKPTGELYREYVPCRRESDGAVGLFLMETNGFYTNSGTAVFEAGCSRTRKTLFFP
ncbi:MAG: hypothetical protein HFF84_09770 [Oscillibacter sp.]|nr:hypothetical protein [Oscillibacter sp.]